MPTGHSSHRPALSLSVAMFQRMSAIGIRHRKRLTAVMSTGANLYIIWQPEHDATYRTGCLWKFTQDIRAIVLYQTKQDARARITRYNITKMHLCGEISFLTATRTRHLHQ